MKNICKYDLSNVAILSRENIKSNSLVDFNALWALYVIMVDDGLIYIYILVCVFKIVLSENTD